MEPVLPPLASLKVGAIINTSSGSASDASEAAMRALLEKAGIAGARLWCGGGDAMDRYLAEAKEAALDVLIVLGGDGTIRSAAQSVTGQGTCLVPLPGGTMNMLPKALYGNDPWETVLERTLANPRAKRVSGGRLGTELFFIAAIIGAPASFAHAREAVRAGRIREAARRALDAFRRRFSVRIRYAFDEAHAGSAEAVSVICPLISAALPDEYPGFEAAVIDVSSIAEVVGLATAAAFGAWREDANVTVVHTTQVRVRSRRHIPAIVDGETVRIGSRSAAEFVPDAFTALVPA